ncbi:MAG TPA: hypothetical protein VF659_16330 [Pyrinomonadaceae bacterium]
MTKPTPPNDDLEVEIDLEEIYWSYPALPADDDAAAPAAPAARDAAPTTAAAPEAAAPPGESAASRAAESSAAAESAEAPAPAAEAPKREAPGGTTAAFHSAIAEIVARVEPAPLRELVGSTFARLLRVLDTLGVIEKALTRPQAVKVSFLFEDVRAQTASLLSHITEAVSSGGAGLDRGLRDVLDGMRFVIGHELSKVFRQEFAGINAERGPAYTRADLSRAWGLLHNCLQQTAISFAQVFSPGVTGAHLFEDYRLKVENSFTLYRELNVLQQKVRAAERSNGILLKHSLVRHMEYFREETMHFLMYKDWGEFGRYVDDVRRAFEEMEEFERVLHEFSQYLSTLIHHVGMREVLRNVPAGEGAAPTPEL